MVFTNPLWRFNRYIVECKVVNTLVSQGRKIGFNRYIVECKVKSRGNGARDLGDLIDTLWNVKVLKLVFTPVLISI